MQYDSTEAICCKLCSEVFEEPLILQCGHSLCKKCVDASVSFSKLRKSSFNPKKIQETNTDVKFSVTCPTCSQTTFIPPSTNISDVLKINFDLRDAVTRMKKNSTKVCSNNCENAASVDCATCGASFCNNCFDTIHSISFFKSHKKEALGEASKKKSLCPEHEGKELELFCKSCQKVVCLMCSFGDHKGHDCVLLSKHVELWKSEIKEDVSSLKTFSERINKAASDIELEINEIKQKHEDITATITQEFNELKKLLEERQVQLIQQSLEVRNEKVSQLESQLSEVKVASKRVGEWCQDYETSLSKNDVNLISIVHIGVKQALRQFFTEEKLLRRSTTKELNFNFNLAKLKTSARTVGSITDIPRASLVPLKYKQGKFTFGAAAPDIALSKGDTVATSTFNDLWNQVLTSKPLEPGTYIEFLVEQISPESVNQWGICIGVGPENSILFGDDAIVGLPPHKGRSFAAHNGDILPFYNMKYTKRIPYGVGNRVRILLNFDRTITLFKDNQFVAIVHCNCRGEIFPTVAFFGEAVVSIVNPSEDKA